MRYVLGIDAGGSKTVGLLADEQGHVVGETRTDAANLYTHGELAVERAFDAVEEAIGRERRPSAVCVGIAGVDRPHDKAVVLGALRRLGFRERVLAVNDAVIALFAGAPERFGIVVLAGTGSICYGAARDGRMARSGGYGSLLADEGSGYWLGHQALRASVRALDGRGPATRLQALTFAALEAESMADVVKRVYEEALPKHRIAALAPLVEEARVAGDAVAAGIVREAGAELALSAASVARQLGLGDEPYPVVLAGGAFKACPSLADAVAASCEPAARPAPLTAEPAAGAVALAKDLLES
ncbi:MAG: BadF/BadG/BcrA/BcrD ATPase family protein [Vicinamibacteria bacterium]